jgi:hypothetical protein
MQLERQRYGGYNNGVATNGPKEGYRWIEELIALGSVMKPPEEAALAKARKMKACNLRLDL